MAGYTRQSVADIINGANITAPPLNAEFNQILAAFNSSTGHSHDGSTGNAPKIPLTTSVSGYLPVVHGGVGGRNNTTATSDPTATNDNTEGYAPGSLWINASTGYTHLCLYNTTNNANWVTLVAASFGTGIIAPKVTNTVDIGTATLQFKDVYVDGVGYIDDINAETMSSTGNTDVGGALAVTGNTTVGGTLGVSGLSTLASLGVTTTLTVGGSVGITGNTIMSGNLTVNGNTTIGNAASDTVTVTADVASHLIPSADSTYDLGATGSEWRNLYIDGTAKIDALEADTADIDGGSVDGTTVGAGTPASGSFAGLTATGTVNLSGATVSNLGAVTTADINGGTVDGVTLGTNSAVTEAQIDNININGNAITSTNSNGNIDLTPAGSGEVNISKVDINGGAIDGTTIGSSSASSGAFTTISTSGQATLATVDINGGTIDGTAIGSTTEASGAFTTLTSSGGITGSLSGNVTGNVTGNITGNVTGDLTGDVTGDVTGNITASSGLSTFNNVVVNGTANFTNTALTNVVDPTNAQDAATKNYVDTNDALKVTKAGDGMTGNLTMSGGAKVTGLPTPTANSDAATKGYVDTEVANLVDSAPGALDTLNELADALGDDPNFSATISAEIATKLPKAGGTMTGAIAMSTNKLTGVGNPTAAQDAATKSYVDTNDALKLNLTGGTMTGDITMGANQVTTTANPVSNDDMARKGYVDTQDALKLSLTGGTMSGVIDMGSNKVTNVTDPTSAQDAATKNYIDTIFGSTSAAAASAANAATSETNAANSATAASGSETNAAASALAAANSYDDFDDRYLGPKATAPTVDNDGDALVLGSLYFNTASDTMQVYGSSGWVPAGSSVNGTSERFKYTSTAAQTTFSGADDNSNSLAYDSGFLDVYLSGVRLVNGTDFTATSGTSIQLTTGATVGDILEVVTFGTFTLSNQSIDDMTDVSISSLSSGQVLKYNGTAWVNGTDEYEVVNDTTPQLGGDLASNGNDINFADNDKAVFGAGSDLSIYHSSSIPGNIIESATNNLYIRSNSLYFQKADGTENNMFAISDGAVSLAYDNNVKLATTSTGIDVTGTVDADQINITSNTPVITFNESDQSNRQYKIGSFGGAYAIYDSTNSQYRYVLDTNGNHIFNEGGVDADFRVESDGNANMLFVDGGNNRVAIGSTGYTSTSDLNLTGKGLSVKNDLNGNGDNWSVIQNDTNSSMANLKFGVGNGNMELTHGAGLIVSPNLDGYHSVFNETSKDCDFRVESNNNSHMLFVDAGNDRVCFGGSASNQGDIQYNCDDIWHISPTTTINYATDGNTDTTPNFRVVVDDDGTTKGRMRFYGYTGSMEELLQIQSDTGSTAGGTTGKGVGFGHAGVFFDRGWGNHPSLTVMNTSATGQTVQGDIRLHGTNSTWSAYPDSGGSDFSTGIYMDGAVTQSSDRRFKTNIESITNALDIVKSMDGKRFQTLTRDGDLETTRSEADGFKYGFIGQELQGAGVDEIYKHHADEDDGTDGYNKAYAVDYASVTALLVNAMKEQQTIIDDLKSRIEALEAN